MEGGTPEVRSQAVLPPDWQARPRGQPVLGRPQRSLATSVAERGKCSCFK